MELRSRRWPAELGAHKVGIKSIVSKKDRVPLVIIYFIFIFVAFGTIMFNFEILQKEKYEWQTIYGDTNGFNLSNKRIVRYLKQQRTLIRIREQVYDFENEKKLDLNEIMAQYNGDEDYISFPIYVSDTENFVDGGQSFQLIQNKVSKSAVAFTKDLSILSDHGEIYDMYDLRDIEEPESGDYCLSFTFRTRNQWFQARINRNCQVVQLVLDIWLTSSYVYMGIGTGAAQREGDLTKELFKFVHEAPEHFVLQTWYFDTKGKPTLQKEDIFLTIDYEVPVKPVTDLHCLTLKGTLIDGSEHETYIDNSCYGAKLNVKHANEADRNYDVIREIRGKEGVARSGVVRSRDTSLIFENKLELSMKIKLGKYKYPVSHIMIDADAKLNGNDNICLHVAVKVGKSAVYRHFLYLERFCELFLHDVKRAQKARTLTVTKGKSNSPKAPRNSFTNRPQRAKPQRTIENLKVKDE